MPKTASKKTSPSRSRRARRSREQILSDTIELQQGRIDHHERLAKDAKRLRDAAKKELEGIKNQQRDLAAQKVAEAQAELERWKAVLSETEAKQ